MRIWMLGVSILVHGMAIAAAFVVPLFATAALPVPPHRTTFHEIVPIEVPPSPHPRPIRPTPTRAASTEASPAEEPDAVLPELPAAGGTDDLAAVTAVPSTASGGFDNGAGAAEPEPAASRTPPIVRVGGSIVAPQKTHHVPPGYPPIALAARKGGLVILEAIIGTSGLVQDVRVLRSEPLFDEAAVSAVQQWRFTPTLLNGMPVRVIMTVTVVFSL